MDYGITSEQKKLLGTFKCERLSSHKLHKNLIQTFECLESANLDEHLKGSAWNKDVEGETRYYIIKDSDKQVVFFFSLKCGNLFKPLKQDEMEKQKANSIAYVNRIDTSDIKEVIRLREKKGIEAFPTDIQEKIEQIYMGYKKHCCLKKNLKKKIYYLQKDMAIEVNSSINRATSTLSGVELVHFCANKHYRDKWKKLGIKQPMGKVFFWKFVVDIIIQVRELVGCRYMFLFAADSSPDGNLINYYHSELGFEIADDITVVKPLYDFGCQFMCQDIIQIHDRREEFFLNFNGGEIEHFGNI